MQQTWTVGKKLFGGVGALALCLAIVAGYLWWKTNDDAARFDDGLARTKKMELAGEVKRLAFELYAAEKITILAGYDQDQENLHTWRDRQGQALAGYQRALEEITPLIALASDKEALAKSKRLVEQLQASSREVQSLIDAGKFHEAQAISREKNRALTDENTKTVEAIVQSQRDRLAEAGVAAKSTEFVSRMMAIALSLLGLAVAGLVGYIVVGINRRLVGMAGELKGGAEQVVAASTQVSTAAQGLSQGATEQAASLEESSASMEEMASMTRRTAENAQQAAQVMGEVFGQMGQSNAMLTEMVASMAAIRESSGRVSKIIKTIDEIAFQTNILALNAAVEAARAGEAGMGFAVVADEVRNLAQRAARAAKDTSGLIEESALAAQQGSDRMEKVAAAIAGVTEGVTRVKTIAEDVNGAARQQAQGIEQVSQAIAQMEKVTQSIAATAEESAAASEELNGQAEASLGVVAALEAMVGGAGRAVGAPRVAARPGGPRRGAPTAGMAGKPRLVSRTPAEEAIPLEPTGTFGSF